jgi:hypothetical protein
MHAVTEILGPYEYVGPVAASAQAENRAAWHGVRYVQRCACGCIRSVLRNGIHEEMGEWYPSTYCARK